MGNPYKKSAKRKALEPQLSGRSKGSVEFKHQNVSAVLVEIDDQWAADAKAYIKWEYQDA